MSKKISYKMITTGALALSLGLAAGAVQANYGGSYGGGTYGTDCSGGGSSNPDCFNWTFNNTRTNTQGKTSTDPGVTATATGWANTGASNALQTAYVGTYSSSGLGVGNSAEGGAGASSPNHSMDNSGKVDSILFTFSENVNLTSFSAGWVQTDSDYTVLAYTAHDGAPAVPDGLGGQTYSGLLSNGWSLIGNYNGTGNSSNSSDHATGTGAHDFANGTFSSYWLIGALNTFVGGDSTKAGNDYFKLISLAGCDCTTAPPGTPGCGGGGNGAPEPGTLLLMSAGFIGLARINRQRKTRSA